MTLYSFLLTGAAPWTMCHHHTNNFISGTVQLPPTALSNLYSVQLDDRRIVNVEVHKLFTVAEDLQDEAKETKKVKKFKDIEAKGAKMVSKLVTPPQVDISVSGDIYPNANADPSPSSHPSTDPSADPNSDPSATDKKRDRKVYKQWTDEEDYIVIDAVTNSSVQPYTQWSDLTESLLGCSGNQIWQRWVNQLNPEINHLPFSHKKFGWAEISTKYFNSTRTNYQIKNHWNSASFKEFISNEFGPEK